MKHSHKDKRPRENKGFAKGRTAMVFRKGPITIEDILDGERPLEKDDVTFREMSLRTDPTNDSSPLIKRKFRPLDNPTKIIEVLQATLNIKQGIVGNNITTVPYQYAYWRQCLAGEALRKFNEFATNVGNKTIVNLTTVEQRLVSEFTTKDVLARECRYIRYDMRKPYSRTTRQYVGAVHTLNQTLARMPPLFDASQQVPESELLDILASKAPQSHKALMIEQGFDPQNATIQQFVEISERAETKESLQKGPVVKFENERYDSDDSYKKVSHKKKDRKSSKHSKHEPNKHARLEFFCKHHGPNSTHNSDTCKVLLNSSDKKSWKDRDSKRDYKDHKSKYKDKTRDLNLLQLSVSKEKAKWKKANATLQLKLNGKNPKKENDSASESSKSISEEDKKPSHARTFQPREHIESHRDSTSSSSSSGSSSSTESDDSR